ncbi:MAG: sugar kinase [Gammaproteobacteria bacterium]|nr:sugar kinase [Gammaproteobacteria bacterium]
MKYLIGLDGGSQSTKVVIVDLDGKVVCRARQPLQPLASPQPGVAEHPDDDLWASTAAALRSALDKFPHPLTDLIGIGVCTIRCCRAELLKDGSLAAPVQNWIDERMSGPWQNSDPAITNVTTSSGYITHRLTGQRVDTAANYEGPWPIDKTTGQWSEDPALIAQFNVPREALFALQVPGSIAGGVSDDAARVTGLPAGLPVVVTANDKAVEALGAGLHGAQPSTRGAALLSLGTYVGAMTADAGYYPTARYFFSNMAALPKQFLQECDGLRYGMGTVSRLIKLFGEDLQQQAVGESLRAEEILNREAADITPGADGLLASPDWQTPARLLTQSNYTRAQLYRALLETIALSMHNKLARMAEELDTKPTSIIVSGGGANSDLMLQIVADVTGLPTSRPALTDAAGLGSAICAAVAVGAADNFEAAAKRMVRLSSRYNPDPENHLFYCSLNEHIYRDLTDSTDQLLQQWQSLPPSGQVSQPT